MEELYALFQKSTGICIDSREDVSGKMFFGLKGESFDGSKFAPDVVERGALCAVIGNAEIYAAVGDMGGRLILVDNALDTLQQLANCHRRHLKIPFFGITGTNGKTTTKELVKAVLSRKYRVAATAGNLNNHIGVPLTLLDVKPSDEISIVEMGASAPGEIAASCRIAEPDYGLVTNVGKAHLQGFGSFEGVKATKGELYDFLKGKDGVVVYNADDPVIVSMMKDRSLLGVAYGRELNRADVLESESPYLKVRIADGDEISTHMVGDYNLNNVLAAVAVGKLFEVPLKEIYAAIEEYQPSNNRSQFIQGKTNRIVIDAYNANPISMHAAVSNFQRLSGENKVLVLGDMRELGDYSLNEHIQILKEVVSRPFSRVFLVGDEFAKAAKEVSLESDRRIGIFRTSVELRACLEKEPVTDSSILIKGSRGIRLEEVLDTLRNS